MKAAIVICAWNCSDQVETAARSAEETCRDAGIPFGILVHDDCSELDPLREKFESWGLPGGSYLRQPKRMGLTHAWNRGVDWALETGCGCVALCNQDIRFAPGWLPRFVAALEKVPAVSPLSNSPGMHSDPRTLQGQDIRKFIPELKGVDIGADRETMAWIMEKIRNNPLIQADGIKGFFLGFNVEWMARNRIAKGEYYSMAHASANGGVGGSENEIFQRLGVRPWIASDVYAHHFREYGNGNVGLARTIFAKKSAAKA